MSIERVNELAPSARRAARPPLRRGLLDPTAAMLAATLVICIATAVALYTLGH